jgi:hypothetical protein
MEADLRKSGIAVAGIAALLAVVLPLQVYALDDVSNLECDAGIVEYGDTAYMLWKSAASPPAGNKTARFGFTIFDRADSFDRSSSPMIPWSGSR